MEREFLQEKSLNRLQSNAEKSLNVDLSAKSRLIPYSDAADMLSLNNLYVEERDACENYRMIFTVNPVCSNVLFNAVTEPVFMEGSDSAICITMSPISRNTDVFDKVFPEGVFNQSGNTVDQIAAIRDTEFSHERIGNFKYHCGYDIFNNHLLRTDDFEHVQLANDDFNKDEFNTIFDYAVDYSGNVVTRVIGESEGPLTGKPQEEKIRMYELDNIKSFNTAFYDGVRNTDGWYGFYNFGYINIPNGELNEKPVSINKVINNEPGCSFIDFYPDRTLYSFIPKVNRYRKRLERNWDCTIVYPYENDYDMFNKVMDPDNREPNAVRVLEAKVTYDNVGNEIIEMHSLLRHTLQAGDTIRLFYAKNEGDIVRYDVPVRVISVGDTEGKEKDRCFLVKYYDFSSICSIDDLPNTTFFYRKIEGGYDDKYYFRKFKELRNYEYIQCDETSEAVSVIKAPEVINDESPKYIKLGNDYFEKFEKPLAYTQNKLAYGENIYGDRIAQVIFTDDICTAGLLDNLGRPLSSVYFTAVKTNKGHKEWYENQDAKSEKVEYSHCFGDVTSGIDLPSGVTNYNVRELYNVQRGGAADVILEEAPTGTSIYGTPLWLESGITLDNDSVNTFYGDIVEFSKTNFTETVLEQVYHRFNTAQRECLANEAFYDIHYDELVSDQYEVPEVEGETPPEPPTPEEEGIEVAFQVLGGNVADAIEYKVFRDGEIITSDTKYNVTEWQIRWFKEHDVIEWSVSATGFDITSYAIEGCGLYQGGASSATIGNCNMLIKIGMEFVPTYEYYAKFSILNGLTANEITYKINDSVPRTVFNVNSYQIPVELNRGDVISYTAKCDDYRDVFSSKAIENPGVTPIEIEFDADYSEYSIKFDVREIWSLITADTISYSAYTGSDISAEPIQTGTTGNESTWLVVNSAVTTDEDHYFKPGDTIVWEAEKNSYYPATGTKTIERKVTNISISLEKIRYELTLLISGGVYSTIIYQKQGSSSREEFNNVSSTTITGLDGGNIINYSARTSGSERYVVTCLGSNHIKYETKLATGSVTIEADPTKLKQKYGIVLEVNSVGNPVPDEKMYFSCPYDILNNPQIYGTTLGTWEWYTFSGDTGNWTRLSGASVYVNSRLSSDFVLPLDLVSALTHEDRQITDVQNLETTLENIVNTEWVFILEPPRNDSLNANLDIRQHNGCGDEHYEYDKWHYYPNEHQGQGMKMPISRLFASYWEAEKASVDLLLNFKKLTYDNVEYTSVTPRIVVGGETLDHNEIVLNEDDINVPVRFRIPKAVTGSTNFELRVYNNRSTREEAYPIRFMNTSTTDWFLDVPNLTFNDLSNNTVYFYNKKTITVTVTHQFSGEVVISRTTPTQPRGSGIGTLAFPEWPGDHTLRTETDTGGYGDYISSSGWTTPFHIGFNYNGNPSPTWSDYNLKVVTKEQEVVYNGPAIGALLSYDDPTPVEERGFDLTYEDLDGSVWTFTP